MISLHVTAHFASYQAVIKRGLVFNAAAHILSPEICAFGWNAQRLEQKQRKPTTSKLRDYCTLMFVSHIHVR